MRAFKFPQLNILGSSFPKIYLAWTRHINSVCTDAKRRVGLLHRKFDPAGVPCLWNSCYDDRLELLKLPRLSTRRKRQKLSLCYRIVTGRSIIPPSFFIHHPCPHLRHNHHLPLYRPRVRTTAHQSSFSASVIPLWNSLHRDLVSSPSCNSFKSCLSLVCL